MVYQGIICEGSKKARELGFPTVNIDLDDASIAGIYAGTVEVEGNQYSAAIYADQNRKILEAHLLDFDGNLYGKEATITLMNKVRDAERIVDEEVLKTTIARDIETVRALFP